MKMTVKRIFGGCALFWGIVFVFTVNGCHPVHAETIMPQTNCVATGDRYSTMVTQCLDGTLTISKDGSTTVCTKNSNGMMVCQKV